MRHDYTFIPRNKVTKAAVLGGVGVGKNLKKVGRQYRRRVFIKQEVRDPLSILSIWKSFKNNLV